MGNRSRRENNFKRLLAFLVMVCFILAGETFVLAQDKATKDEVHFTDGKWEQALQLAKGKHRLIFVDAYAAWCGPCKDLKTRIFTNAKVAAYFNVHFVNISLDMEKGEGVKFGDQYQVESYPTLLFIDSNGRLVKRSDGFLDANELLSLAKKASLNE